MSAASRIRQQAFAFMRAVFRRLPLPEATRDRLRNRALSRVGDWSPPPPRGQVRATRRSGRALVRADEAAIGHVPAGLVGTLPSPLPATLVAFYLPQFHPFAQNDAWWGTGFTEWRNVTRALPQFEGHAQPRLPADLGFYDLRNPQVMREQARLASDHGIGAFCFYYYWFSGQTLMEAPLRQWLADASIELPFCLCWANENWTRRWDGRNQDVLIGQQHSPEDDLAFIAHVADYLRDRRALKVDGRPMLLVYRPQLLPDPKATAQRWRDWCRNHDVGEIHLAYVQSFERPDPREIGFDSAVEFPPNVVNPTSLSANQLLINPDYAGDVRDWRELATESLATPARPYRLHPGVNPGWDNEARRPGGGRVLLHASPRAYGDWLHATIHTRLVDTPVDQRLVFINAWNEWAESAVLEPDLRLGHAWLAATRRALQPRQPPPRRPCVVIHAWYLDVLDEMLELLALSGVDARLIITTTPDRVEAVHALLERAQARAEVIAFNNHGRDILPFLHVADRLLNENEDLVLKLHTKRSTHRDNGDQWRQDMLGALLGGAHAGAIVAAFQADPTLGLVAPSGHLLKADDYVGGNADALAFLQARMGLPAPTGTATFAAGSMYWVRLAALRPLLDAHLSPSDFEAEQGQIDGTLAHALERLTGAIVNAAGFRICDTATALGGSTDPAATPYPYARRS
ncbi:glycoside hydrolase family 99-like domain-containing protein [Stenotrophomonas sp.]|uniref:glycoside hydrolase family 99-like domain-containing protein n=1 Tax=Stenotrophomonas sp. TaxID=69392 RepID=UPI0028A29E75|nr:glycoside hydrolase family 99-like domain-containing protein [Stenotrophomonas sp.]